MKKLVAILLALVLVVSFAACAAPAPAATETEPAADSAAAAATEAPASSNPVVKIGIYEPASGDNGAGGKQETLGVEYANFVSPTVDINGTTYDVQLVKVDNESSNDKAASAASTLVSAGVSVVLGSYGSGVSIAASPTFEAAGIPCIGITCTNPQVTEGNTHYFRICFLDPFQGTVLANYAFTTLGVTKAYCLSKLGDDYSGGLVNYFVKAFEALGGTCVQDTFPDGNSDFTSYINNAKNSECKVFFSPVSTEAAQLIIDQAESQTLGMPILAGDTWDSNVILQAAKGKSVDVTVTTFYPEGANAEFDSGFKTWVNSDATLLANNGGDDTVAAVTAMGYDAYFFALEAMKKAASVEPAAIMAALWGTTYEGVSGPIALDQVNGDAIRNTAYVKHANTETGAWDALPAVTIG
ncbi:MAG: ABC transporter substrate-binding protein [Eubacteriales bacterium]|nr:ABC transporter substrate-binding protein [Eubacteriales bacterium]